MQASELLHDPEQKTATGKDPAKKVLQVLPNTHLAQRNKIKSLILKNTNTELRGDKRRQKDIGR